MAKDQKGHGSNKRGMARVSVNRPVGYTVHAVGPGGEKTLTHSGTLGTVDGKTVNSRDSKVQDRVAANALSSGGPKSDPAPVHEAMRYAPNHPDSNAHQHDYHPESVNKAIANSGRFGGGKIGGREARMIHSILKGRGK